jgi:hypothetical protein
MVDLVARATKDVNIPGRKATRAEIKRMFKDYLRKLKARLNVRAAYINAAQSLTLFLLCVGSDGYR